MLVCNKTVKTITWSINGIFCLLTVNFWLSVLPLENNIQSISQEKPGLQFRVQRFQIKIAGMKTGLLSMNEFLL